MAAEERRYQQPGLDEGRRPGSSRTFTWGTGWFAYEATNPLTDTYQALRNFGIAQKGDIWVGPMDSTGDQPGQIRYRSFATDRYDFDFPYVDEIVIARAGLANPLMFTVRQTSLSTRRA